jgi:hypothetical protein
LRVVLACAYADRRRKAGDLAVYPST